jgi:hypothetical protein
MATTTLSLSATPGKPWSFSAKAPTLPFAALGRYRWQQSYFNRLENQA